MTLTRDNPVATDSRRQGNRFMTALTSDPAIAGALAALSLEEKVLLHRP